MALTINLTGVEPAFAKNTAFNKNFGTSSGDILLLGSTSVASKVLVTDSNNKVKTSSTTETQLSYLDATSSIQTQVDNKVPYTGATSDVNLGEFGIQLGNLEFDNTPTNVPTAAGSLYYNDTDGTLDLKLKGGNVTLQIGQEQLVRVVNKTATSISLLEANYQAVRITGSQGQRLKVDLALATTDVLSAETIGLVTETIANNQEGFITTSGLVRGINTTGSLQSETWADGDILYLSGVTAGNITNVKPLSPLHLIVIGYVVYAHITQGTIYVKVDNGYELDELHDVLLSSRTDKDILAYESSTSLWKNKTASSLGLAPLASPTFTGTVTSPAIILSSETASTIASFDASKNIKSLDTATYPSLTELSYVKGVTQSIQPLLTDARDLKYAAYDNTDKTITGTTAETYLAGLLVPTLTANSSLDFLAIPNKTGTAGTIIWNLYYNTTNNMAGTPVKIGTYTHTAVSLYGGQFIRRIVYKNSLTSAMIFRATVASANDFNGNATAMSSLAIDLSAKYLVLTATLTSAADTAILSSFQLMHTKP